MLPDVDPKEIAEGLFWGAFINSGQTCAALKRLYVHDDVHDEVCSELVAIAEKMKMGEGTSEDVVLGPVQNAKQYDIVADLTASAKSGGVKRSGVGVEFGEEGLLEYTDIQVVFS